MLKTLQTSHLFEDHSPLDIVAVLPSLIAIKVSSLGTIDDVITEIYVSLLHVGSLDNCLVDLHLNG